MSDPSSRSAVLAVALLGLLACGTSGSEGAPPAATSAAAPPVATPAPVGSLRRSLGPIPDKCRRPLEEYCDSKPCPTYESAVREAVEIGGRPSLGQCVAHEGVCGGLRFVTQGDGYTSSTGFFDASGRLVAALRGSDTTSFCGRTSGTVLHGPLPACNQVVHMEYCTAP